MLSEAAVLIRKDIFSHNDLKCSGSLPENCQDNDFFYVLKLFIVTILNSPNLEPHDKKY